MRSGLSARQWPRNERSHRVDSRTLSVLTVFWCLQSHVWSYLFLHEYYVTTVFSVMTKAWRKIVAIRTFKIKTTTIAISRWTFFYCYFFSEISFSIKIKFVLVHFSTLSMMSVNLNTTLYPDSPCVKVFYNKSYELNRRTLSATIIGFRVIPL